MTGYIGTHLVEAGTHVVKPPSAFSSIGHISDAAIFSAESVPDCARTVAVLLGVYNGEQFLSEQLESIAGQSHADWKVWVSDDGSQDNTHAILEKYRVAWGDECLSVIRGARQGFVANFLSLVCNASIQANYYAYADQDDIWETDKLSRAIRWLESQPDSTPALYCSRTCLVDANNRHFGFSPLFTRTPSFSNALVQNIGGGNTMVFNDAARRLLVGTGVNGRVIAHDWWTYMVVVGGGGEVFYDPVPTVRYRQHGSNVIGSGVGWFARVKRFRLLLKGSFKTWTEQHIQALQQIHTLLTPENRAILEQFASARSRQLLPRLIGLKRSKVYRQTIMGNLGLVVAAILGKI